MADFRHETARLVMRDWQGADWPRFWEGTNTPAVMRWLGGVCDAEKRRGAQDRLLSYRAQHGHTFWVVERKDDGAILGFCGLKRCNQAGGPIGMMEIGWRLREDAWGQGFAKEAAAACWGLMERLGMRRREDLDFANADFDPADPTIIVYSIAADAWEKARG